MFHIISIPRIVLLALSLSLMTSGLAQSQSLASTRNSPQSADEETVRNLTEQYGLTVAGGQLERMRQLWDPQSPNLASRLRFYQGFFSNIRIEFISVKVTRLEVTGERAVSHLTTDERYLDKKTGAILSERDAYHGYCRAIEWIKRGDAWKIEREFSVQEELAARLEAAASEQERAELLEKEKTFVTDSMVRALNGRGNSYRLRGDNDAALRSYQWELAVAEKIGDQAGVAGAWMNFGILKQIQDDYQQALQLLLKALALYEGLKLKRGVAVVREKLSDVYRALGDQRQAFDNAQKALLLYEEGNNRRRMADVLSDLALVYEAQNNSQQALAYLGRALAIAQELEDKILIAILRHEIANQHKELGDYERALEIHQGILKQTEGFGDQGGAAMIRSEIGRVFTAQHRYAEALDYHRQALAVLEAANSRRSIIGVLIDMSGVFLAQEKYADALPIAQRAMALSRQTGQQFELWLALTALGYSQVGLHRPLEARQSFAEALSIIEKLRTQTAGGAEERQRYFEGGLRAHHGMIGLLVKENQTHEALVFAERAKARVLLDILQQGRASVQKAMTKEEQERELQLKAELRQLNKQLARATMPDKPDARRISEIEQRLEKARLNYEDFQNSLYAAHPELKAQRGKAPIINAEELTALLPDDTSALVEYTVTDDEIYLFAITKAVGKVEADIRVYTVPIKRGELARQIEAFRQQLAGRDLGFRASAVKLYELLLKPAEAELRGKANIVIVPDDRLWDLPFQALVTGVDRFLIENAAISYVPSLTVLREMARRRKNQPVNAGLATLLAVGNPGKESINGASQKRSNENLHPLPEAEQEVKALSRLYGIARSKVYVGAEASEYRVKNEAGQAGILHFAAHGMLNNASPMYSHLALAEGGTSEDGLLEAWELMQLDLKADLAVLSACETARGRIGAGEGMIGLSWAMFIAGVPSLVVSQWKVESAGTRDLMVNFHRALIKQPVVGRATPPKAQALRQAALKLMKNDETRHPFYWAGFVLVGDFR